MKAFLMYRDRDFDLERKLPWNEPDLTQDLELDTLFGAMSQGDTYLFDVAKKALLSSTSDLNTLLYRQYILADCLKNPSVVRALYDLAVQTIDSERKNYWGILREYPELGAEQIDRCDGDVCGPVQETEKDG